MLEFWGVHPLKINILNPKMKVWKMISLSKLMIFRFHVDFPGCNKILVASDKIKNAMFKTQERLGGGFNPFEKY